MNQLSPTPPAPARRMRECVGITLRACTVFCLLLTLTTGCSSKKTSTPTPSQAGSHSQQTAARETTVGHPASEVIAATEQNAQNGSCLSPQQILESEQNRASCFRLQPAKTIRVQQATTGKKAKVSGKAGKASKSAPKTAIKATPKTSAKGKTSNTSATAGSTGKTTKRVAAPLVERTVGLCQPQSLIYARCRTGITTCQLGDTSPVQWFNCARKNGATTATPVAGSVIVIDTHKERRIYTGHPAYVEAVHRNDDGTWTLRISHTNYDRQCHLDQDAQVLFDPRAMTATFQTGPWAPWAHRLRVLGFIVR